jgi:type II secretory pathway component PulF
MPYYAWKGIDPLEKEHFGKTFIRNVPELYKYLGNQSIELVIARELKPVRQKPISRALLSQASEHMGSLLEAGLRLDESLDLCAKTVHHKLFRFIILDSSQAVREGINLHDVFEEYVPLIETLFVALIKAGEESGELCKTFKTLEVHYKTQEELARKLRSALLLPMITVLFFCMIAIGIFTIVIPRFEHLFVMLQKPVPPTTQFLFTISRFFQKRGLLLVSLLLALGIGFVVVMKKSLTLKKWWHFSIVHIPQIGKITRYYSLTLFLQTLAVLLQGQLHLVKSLSLASQTVTNRYVKEALEKVCHDVESGIPLSKALSLYPLTAAEDVRSLCAMGEASGTLPLMVLKAAQLYQHKTYSALSTVATLIPPLLLVILGSLVALLIFAVYTPLLTLSRVIG